MHNGYSNCQIDTVSAPNQDTWWLKVQTNLLPIIYGTQIAARHKRQKVLVCRNFSLTHQLAPLVGFLLHEGCELSTGGRGARQAKLGERVLGALIVEHFDNLCIPFVHNGRRNFGRG